MIINYIRQLLSFLVINCELVEKNVELKVKPHLKVKGEHVSHRKAGYKTDSLFWNLLGRHIKDKHLNDVI